MRSAAIRSLMIAGVVAAALPAFAQEDASVSNSAAAVASLQVQINQLHDEIRGLRGQLEQAQYEARMNADALKKYETDADYRLQAIEQKQAAGVAPPAGAANAALAPRTASGFSPDAGANGVDAEAPVADGNPTPASYQKTVVKPTAADGQPTAPTGKDFPDANAHYNYAFKLLNDKNYAAAAASFDAFVKKYPTDPLTGNAYYWLGESYYARGDYVRASDGFRKGFEAAPDGQKAADNLFKLGLSLAEIKRVPEACIVLAQVSSKYAQTNAHTAARAETERTNLQCK